MYLQVTNRKTDMGSNTQQVQRKFTGRIIAVDIETVTLPNGHQFELEVVQHPGGAAVVVLDDKGRVCLLRQYRHVAGQWLWELPAGKIDQGETPLSTAQRELAEEAGVTATQWQELGKIYTSPGVFKEVIHLYLAQDIQATAVMHEAEELIEIQWVDLQKALSWAKNGQIIDAKTLIGLFRAATLIDPGQ